MLVRTPHESKGVGLGSGGVLIVGAQSAAADARCGVIERKTICTIAAYWIRVSWVNVWSKPTAQRWQMANTLPSILTGHDISCPYDQQSRRAGMPNGMRGAKEVCRA